MTLRKKAVLLLALLLTAGLAACHAGQTAEESAASGAQAAVPGPSEEADLPDSTGQTETEEETKETGGTAVEQTLRLLIGDTEVAVAWEDNASVDALKDLAAAGPLTVQMRMYGGFEQVGPLGADLPRDDTETTTQAGDIVLYSGDQIVVFYGSNTWAYTRLGRITDKTEEELAELLGNGNVTLTVFG